jgi:hypothetical protein
MTIAATGTRFARHKRMLCLVRRYMFGTAQLSLLHSAYIEIKSTLATRAIA